MQIKRLQVNLSVGKTALRAVDNIDFSLVQGETLALLGESGSGKSMTALSLMRLLPLQATYGLQSEINLEEQDLLDLPEVMMRRLRGKRLAIIFQEPMSALNPVLRIDQQLAEALLQYQPLSKKALHKRMIELLHEVEIHEPELRLQQYPHQLSGGLKQRIVIAMALANNPDILIADEPTTALDVTIQAQILALLKRLQQSYCMSMLLITHDLGVVKAAADKVCVMYAGQIVEQASVADFFKHPKHPYAQHLLASLPNTVKRNKRLFNIKGSVPNLDALPPGCRFHPRCAHAFERCHQEMPLLQTVENQQVRCHLYPKYQQLPPLIVDEQSHVESARNDEVVLTVQNLHVYFRQGKSWFNKSPVIKAVDGLSFQLYEGKTLALVGESGCGKTTASRAIIRLQPITQGHILYRGQAVEQMSHKALREYRKRVQIIFQDPFSSMNPRLTVGEIIAEGLRIQGMGKANIQQRQKILLEQVNLPLNSLDRYPHQFSGGQRQRISIARALATEPEILICDEPTSALDISVQAQILNLLKDLQHQLSISYLFITHNMAIVDYMAHDVLVMRFGKKVEEGTVDDVFKHPKQEYTRQLLASVLQV